MQETMYHHAMWIARLASIEKSLTRNAAARKSMQRWIDKAEAAQWKSITDARRMFPTTDAIKGTNLTCFNIGGNNYRLLAIVSYQLQQITIVELLTHAEYSRKYAR